MPFYVSAHSQNEEATVANGKWKGLEPEYVLIGRIMAAWHELKTRVAALEDSGLNVASDYKGDGLPKWLLPALGECDVPSWKT